MKQTKLLLIIFILIFVKTGCVADNKVHKKEIIQATEILKKINKSEQIKYVNVVVKGDLDFTSANNKVIIAKGLIRVYISSPVTFVNCKFEGKVSAYKKDENDNLNYCIFEKNLTMINCEFNDEVNFRETNFSGAVNFSSSSFDKKIIFEGAVFNNKDNYFTDCYFKDEFRGQRIFVKGNISFLKSTFVNKARFQRAVFKGNAQFGAVKFLEYTDFGSITVQNGILFNHSDFSKKAKFNNSILYGRTEFMHCQFSLIAEFKNVLFYGPVKFTETNFQDNLDLENSKFLLGIPETKDAVLPDSSKINLNNTQYSIFKNLKISEIK
ncbi:MAG: pentapeptide repeat-containing protein [Bacteroidales bacterium]|nr:pentapeptide repeat-containing protein [Bacteroidales bacterium]